MGYATATLKHPDLTDEQRATMARLIRAYGAPFAFSVVASSALPCWQNIGTVSIRCDGEAKALSGRPLL
jgi:hypothetical protein